MSRKLWLIICMSMIISLNSRASAQNEIRLIDMDWNSANQIVQSFSDGRIIIRGLDNKVISEFKPPFDPYLVKWTPVASSSKIAVAERYGSIHIMDTITGKVITDLLSDRLPSAIIVSGGVREIDWSNDGKYLSLMLGGQGVADEDYVIVWDMSSSKPILVDAILRDFGFADAKWNPIQANLLAVLQRDCRVQVWNVATQEKVSELTEQRKEYSCQGLDWSPNGKKLAFGYDDQSRVDFAEFGISRNKLEIWTPEDNTKVEVDIISQIHTIEWRDAPDNLTITFQFADQVVSIDPMTLTQLATPRVFFRDRGVDIVKAVSPIDTTIAWTPNLYSDGTLFFLFPTGYQDLVLTPTCSPDPTKMLRWTVYNPNTFPVPFTWRTYADYTGDSLVAKPRASIQIDSEAINEVQVVRIYVNGQAQFVSARSDQKSE